ncbi:MAG: hypothetical protein B6D58_08835 [candidate division Zixibacteria bacterium 4484_95]|nr:MAG: hypothetical protein B6D58_08835 [candidate division Zixibacteria bacterium 4484_95]
MKRIILVTFLMLFSENIGLAQDSTDIPPPDTSRSLSGQYESEVKPEVDKSIWKITGDLGTYGEYYSVSGREARRPSTTGRIFLRPTLTLFGSFSASLNIIYSTEGSSAKQHINQFAVHPQWSWGTLHIGDFSHKLSKYTLSGVSIRGAGIDINAGIFRFQAVGGQTKRKVVAGAYNSVYSQNLYGAKIGIGREESSFFDINVVKVKDNVGSLPLDIFQVDSLEVDTTTSPDTSSIDSIPEYGVTPQENLVVGANTVLKLFGRSLIFRGELAGSAYTRNLYSSSEASEDIPSFVKKVYTPRISSNFDYAYAAELNFSQRIFNARGAYTYIGPGYTSLGLSSNMNDKQTIEGGLGFRLFENRVSLQGTFNAQNDNVASQKTNTTKRSTYGLNATIRPLNQISIGFNAMLNVMKNDASSDSTWIVQDSVWNEQDSTWSEPDSVLYIGKIHNENSSYAANVMYQFNMFNSSHSISMNYSTQFSKDLNPTRSGNDVNTQNVMITLVLMLSRSWSMSVNTNLNTVDVESQGKTTKKCLGLQLTNRMLNGNLSNSLGTNYTDSEEAMATNMTFQSSYSITRVDIIRLSAKSSFYKYNNNSSPDFNEYIASIGYTHRF